MRFSARNAANWGTIRSCLLTGLGVVISAGLIGCHGSDSLPSLYVYEVKGRVELADGKPLPGGVVSFVSTAGLPVTPSGVINADGSFSLSTGGSGEGAPPGEYKVRVEAPQFQQADPKHRKRPLFPFKYTDEDSSGIVVTVRPQVNDLEPFRLR